MVLHLLGEVPEVRGIQLECLTENRVEWLGDSVSATGMVLAEDEDGDVDQSQRLILDAVRLHEQILVLHHLCKLLEHGERLVEVHRHGHSRQVLPNRVFDDLPDGHFLIWILESWQAVPALAEVGLPREVA